MITALVILVSILIALQILRWPIAQLGRWRVKVTTKFIETKNRYGHGTGWGYTHTEVRVVKPGSPYIVMARRKPGIGDEKDGVDFSEWLMESTLTAKSVANDMNQTQKRLKR